MHNKQSIEGLRYIISNILASEYGVAFFKWFELECGYNASNLVVDSNGRINTDATIINEALRRFYLNIRNYMSKEGRKEVADFDLEQFFKTVQLKEDK